MREGYHTPQIAQEIAFDSTGEEVAESRTQSVAVAVLQKGSQGLNPSLTDSPSRGASRAALLA